MHQPPEHCRGLWVICHRNPLYRCSDPEQWFRGSPGIRIQSSFVHCFSSRFYGSVRSSARSVSKCIMIQSAIFYLCKIFTHCPLGINCFRDEMLYSFASDSHLRGALRDPVTRRVLSAGRKERSHRRYLASACVP